MGAVFRCRGAHLPPFALHNNSNPPYRRSQSRQCRNNDVQVPSAKKAVPTCQQVIKNQDRIKRSDGACR
jgi:hypothetical protein